jgi:ATP-dependent Clp protease ATP-binding subunit ClpA
MIPMSIGPISSLMTAAIFMILIARYSVPMAAFITLAAAIAATAILLRKTNRLPRWIMDVLDRLTNRDRLEQEYERRRLTPKVIDADALFERLKGKVIGQDSVIRSIATQLRRRLAGHRPEKPIAVFCLAGPPGVGKTYFAKTLAEALYGDRTHLHFFDMSQFGQAHAAASLFGQARGYVGSTSYGALTGALRERPNSIVLLDEFEKAHPDVHKRFLTAWNDGFVTETSDGARISTSETIFILTTNAASRRIGEIAREHSGSLEELDMLIKKALLDAQFAPEVLSRIDEVFAFRPLTGLDVARVVALEIEAIAKQYNLAIADGGVDPPVLLEAIDQTEGADDGGVRDIARNIERQITDGLIDARAAGAKKVRIVKQGDKVAIVPAEASDARAVRAPEGGPIAKSAAS